MLGYNSISGFAFHLLPLLLSVLAPVACSDNEVQFYPTQLLTEPVEAVYEASLHPNRPLISGINATSYAWYWYGAQSFDLSQSFSVILDLGQQSPPNGNIVPRAQVFGTFPNRTQWAYSLNATGGATIYSSDDGSQIGAWEGTGVSWTSDVNRTSYTILLNTPEVKGNVQLKPVTPAQTPCDVWEEGADTTWMPGFAWINAVPMADVYVNLKIRDESFEYDGTGYLDINYGTQPTSATMNAWWWGMARLGDWSAIYLQYKRWDGTYRTNTIVSHNGTLIRKACDDDLFRLSLPGSTNTINPYPEMPFPKGYHWTIDLGPKHGIFNATFRETAPVQNSSVYTLSIGEASGTVGKSKVMKGPGYWDFSNLCKLPSNLWGNETGCAQ